MEDVNMIDDFHTTLKDGVESTQSALSLNTTPSCNAYENDKEIELFRLKVKRKENKPW